MNMCLESLPGSWDWRDWSVVVNALEGDWITRDDWISLTFPPRLRLLSKRHQRIDKDSSVHFPYDDSK